MMSEPELTEKQLAATVIEWLEPQASDIWQEVELRGGVADIVAKVGDEFWIVETKLVFSVELVAQAIQRRRHHYSHRVIVAVPRKHSPYHRATTRMRIVCEELGFGLVIVRGEQRFGAHVIAPSVEHEVHGKLFAAEDGALARVLRDEHKTHAKAGSKEGRFTPFVGTCEKLAAVVKAEPGITLSDAIGKIEHHYASRVSARSSLRIWISKGKVPGVRLGIGGACAEQTDALFPVPVQSAP